jgi:hypothetical protein
LGVTDDAACGFGNGGATAVQRRKRGSPAGGLWGETVMGVTTSQCCCWLGVTAEREVADAPEAFDNDHAGRRSRAWRRTVNRGWLKVVSGTHLAEAPYDEP